MKYKITFISDIHSKQDLITKDLTSGDILICSGDLTNMGYFEELKLFCQWYNSLKNYDYRIFIAGNHDFCFQNNPDKCTEILDNYWNIDYLEDNLFLVGENYHDSLKVWGTPWQPEFFNWAFNLPRNGEELKQKWDIIPDDTDILITHGPPFGILDAIINKTEHLGCELLRERIDILNPKIHVFGHIHSGRGYYFNGKTHFINASCLNERYNYTQKPINIIWDNETNEIEFV